MIIEARPPLFEEIAAAFPIVRTHKGIIYAWGDRIYNPDGITIPGELLVHERVHMDRQGSAVEMWWRFYLADPEFRLREEIPAHVAEHRAFCRDYATGGWAKARRMHLHYAAQRLSSPIYGSMITYDRARTAIKKAA